jgi:hypothetical protein
MCELWTPPPAGAHCDPNRKYFSSSRLNKTGSLKTGIIRVSVAEEATEIKLCEVDANKYKRSPDEQANYLEKIVANLRLWGRWEYAEYAVPI